MGITKQEFEKIGQIIDEKLDKKLDEKLDQKLANFATKEYLDGKLSNFATKDDLKGFVTKDDLKAMESRIDAKFDSQTKELKAYADEQTEHLAQMIANTVALPLQDLLDERQIAEVQI